MILAEQLMASEVITREGDKLRRRLSALTRKDLGVNMAGEVLDPYLAEASFRWDWRVRKTS